MITEERDNAIAEARRVMNICNACRYCEGICATFQAMSLRRLFDKDDLHYLANLCHNCTACYHDCQYAPPHVFSVNVPRALTELRVQTYEEYAWPRPLGNLFRRNGLVMSLTTALLLSIVMLLSVVLIDSDVLFSAHSGDGSFYAVIGHGPMVVVAGVAFGFSMIALAIGLRNFWRATGSAMPKRSVLAALGTAVRDVMTLTHLGGGHGEGCNTRDEGYSNQRRYFHQLTMFGFVLCFLATCVATIYDYGFGRIAPYPFLSLPVLLGTSGGIGLLIGPAGLTWVKLQSDTRPMVVRHYGMDFAFLALLFFTSLTGLLLLVLRDTAAMGIALIVHLGFVLAFFVTMPYSKFVHAIYRFAALLRFAAEKS